jgi:hypothetical protein
MVHQVVDEGVTKEVEVVVVVVVAEAVSVAPPEVTSGVVRPRHSSSFPMSVNATNL